MKPTDALVIGGGPAGTASALFLNRLGYDVRLLEQARFPRDKVCGEFISPAADPIFEELGVLEDLEARNPVRLKGVAIASYNTAGFAVDYPALAGRNEAMTSLSVPRSILDPLLLAKVKASGVEVREGCKATDFILEAGRVAGVRGRDESGKEFSLRARVVIDAGGRNCLSIRRFKLRKNRRPGAKIALAAHWKDVAALKDYCHMHISEPGYTGMAPTGKDEANIVLVVDKECLKGEDLHGFYVRTVLKNPLRRRLLEGGTVAEKARTVDSLEFAVRPPKVGGLILVGDATGFIDPFTGEGIYLSLRSAQIAAGVLREAFAAGDVSRRWLMRYDSLRHREFDRKYLLSRILQALIHRPVLCDRVVRTLERHPDLAGTLVGVIGDYVPAHRVVSLRFLVKLMVKSVRSARAIPSLERIGARSGL